MTNTTNADDAPMVFVACSDIAVGDAIVERDGFLLAVMSIERTGSMVTAQLASDFAMMPEWRSTGPGVTLRKRASTRIGIIRGGGHMALSSPEPR